MKPSPFTYHAPESVDEALAVLSEVGADGKVLAGGQSLIPLLNMRLAAPGHLVDINRIASLDVVERRRDGLHVSARVRHARLERDDEVAAVNPLLRQALRHVAHPVIRNRGTVVGSIAHADPAAEMPAVLAVLGGEVALRSAAGTRSVAAADFFLAPLESDVRAGELVTGVSFPDPGPRAGTAFEELARRHGDYAMAGVAAVVALDDDGRIADARASFVGVGPVPMVVDLTAACAGQVGAAADWSDAVGSARRTIEPEDDIHATADYRRHLAGVLLERALGLAASRAAADDGAGS